MKGILLLERMRPGLRLSVALFLALALLTSIAATPAAAAEKPSDHQYKPRDHNNNHHNNNNHNNNNGGGSASDPDQESEQETDSGDVDQSFTVTGGGDNSNQCAGLQGEAQSGNAQDQIDLLQANSEADDFEFDEVGSSIESNPENSTDCSQSVNQAASASANKGFCTWSGSWCLWSKDASWWYWDGAARWGPYLSMTTASNVAKGALNTAGGLTTLGVLGTLGLAGTGLMIRRSRSS
jgi:hypothetical protein